MPVNYLTAAIALYKMAALAPNETVLVHNAGGGVGIAATQLARLRRATVIGTASAHETRRAAHPSASITRSTIGTPTSLTKCGRSREGAAWT